jgi:hypothetical protein
MAGHEGQNNKLDHHRTSFPRHHGRPKQAPWLRNLASSWLLGPLLGMPEMRASPLQLLPSEQRERSDRPRPDLDLGWRSGSSPGQDAQSAVRPPQKPIY